MKPFTHLFVACLLFTLGTPILADNESARFATAQDALTELMSAVDNKDSSALLSIFGASAQDIISSGNADRDAEVQASLSALYREGFRFLPVSETEIEVLLGADGWPFPIPLSRDGDGWHFDTDAGRTEVLMRRIGLNELEAIETLLVYSDIQSAYRRIDHDGDGVMEFAAHLLSSPGTRDGLYWGDADSPFGERIALAELDGYSDGEQDFAPEPFGGYYYQILTGQGPSAPGGEMDYLVNGNMVAGHALLATPSDYGASGIMSFMIAENGVVYEADLGEDGLSTAHSITRFDPDTRWNVLALD